MANDHAKDRYDPPSVGSEFDEDRFSEINPGEVFRLFMNNDSKIYRKTNDNFALDLKEGVEIQFDPNEKIYVKS
jgi:hypothetical protein|tara:strand:- start:293 stop:514 length:222 start_codon:yes stop_codon:yes gene_type:complete